RGGAPGRRPGGRPPRARAAGPRCRRTSRCRPRRRAAWRLRRGGARGGRPQRRTGEAEPRGGGRVGGGMRVGRAGRGGGRGGGGGALGGAVAVALAGRGARVIGTVRRASAPTATGVELVAVDLSDAAAVELMVADVVERHGRIDALVNAAGGYRGGPPLGET